MCATSRRPVTAPLRPTQLRVPTVRTMASADIAVKAQPGVTILGAVTQQQAEVLTPAAQDFLVVLHRCFNARWGLIRDGFSSRDLRSHEWRTSRTCGCCVTQNLWPQGAPRGSPTRPECRQQPRKLRS